MKTPFKARTAFELLSLDSHSRVFKRWLKQKSSDLELGSKPASFILVEYEQPPDNIIALFHFLPRLMKRSSCQIQFYNMRQHKRITGFKTRLRYRWSVSYLFSKMPLLLIKSQNSNIETKFNKYKSAYAFEPTPQGLLDFGIEGVNIGDLIYDKYLVENHVPTVVMDSDEFKRNFVECIDYFLAFQEIFRSQNISYVCVSHSIYHFGIPARIALKQGIEVFQVSAETIFRLNAKHPYAFTDERDYKQLLEKIDPDHLRDGRIGAREKLRSRLEGSLSEDTPYMRSSPFVDTNATSTLSKKQEKIRILIAAHDFYDSPHVLGNHFYPDFLLWIRALGEISNQTNYEWWIKTHPYLRGAGREILSELCIEFPAFQLLEQEISHPEIIKSGVDFVLTVYGTIAHEYPYLGIPVINASVNNPHSSFTFSHTPSNRLEYEKVLGNLSLFSYEIFKEEIEKFYFLKYIYTPKTWVFQDYSKYLNDMNYGTRDMSREVYSYYLLGNNSRNHDEIAQIIDKFLDSGDIRIYTHHFLQND